MFNWSPCICTKYIINILICIYIVCRYFKCIFFFYCVSSQYYMHFFRSTFSPSLHESYYSKTKIPKVLNLSHFWELFYFYFFFSWYICSNYGFFMEHTNLYADMKKLFVHLMLVKCWLFFFYVFPNIQDGYFHRNLETDLDS